MLQILIIKINVLFGNVPGCCIRTRTPPALTGRGTGCSRGTGSEEENKIRFLLLCGKQLCWHSFFEQLAATFHGSFQQVLFGS